MQEASEAGLADRLRARTSALHRQAEQSGILADLLAGRGDRAGYALLLRNLLPAYRELEGGLERYRKLPGLDAIARPDVYRVASLESDLRALHGEDWAASLPLVDAAERYARRISEAARRGASGLLGHAYARLLGDLNGGRILGRLLARSLALEPQALAFCAYPQIPDLEAFKAAYRRAFDAAAAYVEFEDVAEEALAAFRLNIDVSEEVRRASVERSSPGPGR